MTAAVIPGSVHIIGAGLLGTSVGLALRRAGVDVTLEDSNAEHLRTAVEKGAGRITDAGEIPVLVLTPILPAWWVGIRWLGERAPARRAHAQTCWTTESGSSLRHPRWTLMRCAWCIG